VADANRPKQEVDPAVVHRVLGGERMRMTAAERAVVIGKLGAEGLSSSEIAFRLGLAQRTVQRHRAGSRMHARPLTERELSVIQLIAAGDSPAEVADRLGLSSQWMVNADLGLVRDKLGARTTAEAAVMACRLGLLDEDGCE
jgi:DNA-binding CsgD family transcriptional regulator